MDDIIEINKALFEKELLATGRSGLRELLDVLERYHYFDKAKCHGHDQYSGGTVNHSLWVLFAAREMLNRHPKRYSGVDPVSLTLVCLLHDICDMPSGFSQWPRPMHGSRSAYILDTLNVELTDEELAAIRFHAGHKIRNGLDKRLDQCSKTSLARLLMNSDKVASGVMNRIPFGRQNSFFPILEQVSRVTIYYDPEGKHWYLDTYGFRHDSITTYHGDIPLNAMKTRTADCMFGINLFHMSAFDLRVLKSETGGLGVFTVSKCMGESEGDFYRTDRGGLGYRTVILYRNRFRSKEARHFLVTENSRGSWSVVSLKNGHKEFIEREQLVKGADSEKDALYHLLHRHHGIDITNDLYFKRMDCGNTNIEYKDE